jgi:hypothetical protein
MSALVIAECCPTPILAAASFRRVSKFWRQWCMAGIPSCAEHITPNIGRRRAMLEASSPRLASEDHDVYEHEPCKPRRSCRPRMRLCKKMGRGKISRYPRHAVRA